jgi:hypothetical protein
MNKDLKWVALVQKLKTASSVPDILASPSLSENTSNSPCHIEFSKIIYKIHLQSLTILAIHLLTYYKTKRRGISGSNPSHKHNHPKSYYYHAKV